MRRDKSFLVPCGLRSIIKHSRRRREYVVTIPADIAELLLKRGVRKILLWIELPASVVENAKNKGG